MKKNISQRNNHNVSQRRSGFTLIEMMVVVAILAILATMAVPSLLNSTIRAQVKESLAFAELAKKGVGAVYAGTGEMPANNAAAGVPEANKMISNFISAVTVDNGAVTMTYGNNAHSSIKGMRITMRPAIVADAPSVPIAWVCASKRVPDGMTIKGQDATNLKPQWLPGECN